MILIVEILNWSGCTRYSYAHDTGAALSFIEKEGYVGGPDSWNHCSDEGRKAYFTDSEGAYTAPSSCFETQLKYRRSLQSTEPKNHES